VSRLAKLLAEAVGGREVDVVCGPATGGLVVSQWTAHHLRLPSVFAEHGKEHGYDPRAPQPGPLRPPFVLKRGYDRLVAGKRVLVVDDVINTGESVAETGAAVEAAAGQVVTVAAVVQPRQRRPRGGAVRRLHLAGRGGDFELAGVRLRAVSQRRADQHTVRARGRLPGGPAARVVLHRLEVWASFA
jgi:orotate phosphoribosyltransferase